MTNQSLVETYWDFTELNEDSVGESLMLRFSPSSTPLQQRWRNNGLSADFLAGYVSTFLPVGADDPESARRQSDISAAVGYVANELLENAMKYGADAAGKSISMRLHLEEHRIVFHQTNVAGSARVAALRRFIAQLSQLGAADLLWRQMENGGDENGPGLGLLTMVNDYGARLAFHIAACEPTDSFMITTQVVLDI